MQAVLARPSLQQMIFVRVVLFALNGISQIKITVLLVAKINLIEGKISPMAIWKFSHILSISISKTMPMNLVTFT